MATKTRKKTAAPEAAEKRPPGRPPLDPELRRSAMLQMRTYPEIVEKAKRNGTVWLERLITRAADRPPGSGDAGE